jgi:hypothetical protein
METNQTEKTPYPADPMKLSEIFDRDYLLLIAALAAAITILALALNS